MVTAGGVGVAGVGFADGVCEGDDEGDIHYSDKMEIWFQVWPVDLEDLTN